jgi:pyruvate dehydrogenase E1 component beta subunit
MPGLKMVVPSGPRNARALLRAAIRDPDPVIFFEPKASYRAFREEVPDDDELAEIGKAVTVQKGDDLTLVAYGAMMPRAREAVETLAEDDITVDLIDLLTLSPLDWPTVTASVRRTGRCVVVHEAPLSYGPGAEIAARVMEDAFLRLKAPVARVAGPDVHVPYFAREQTYLPDCDRILKACRAVIDY